MRLRCTPRFARAYAKAPEEIQRAFDKPSLFLLQWLRHPSLRAKKYDEGTGQWQARATRDWRFYFLIRGDEYILQDIVPHPK